MTKIYWVYPISSNSDDSLLGLCRAPGRNEVNPLSKDKHLNLKEDIQNFVKLNVKVIICLLNKYELSHIGIELKIYKEICQYNEINLIVFPIIEMSIPETKIEKIDSEIIDPIFEDLNNKKRVVIHCRGGIGRAGTIAALILLKSDSLKSSDETFVYLRKTRHEKCVESAKQENYVRAYERFLKLKNKLIKKKPVEF